MNYEESAAKAASDALAKVGQAATYTPPGGGSPIACMVLVERGRTLAPDSTLPMIGSRRTQITLLAAEVAAPKRDGVIIVGADTYIIDAVLEDEDGYLVPVLVK